MARNGIGVFELTYNNFTTVDTTCVTLVEQVLASTKFDAANSTPGWTCINGAPADALCTFSMSLFKGGASSSVKFAVKVDVTVVNGTNIVNTACIRTAGEEQVTSNSTATASFAVAGGTNVGGGTVAFRYGVYLPLAMASRGR